MVKLGNPNQHPSSWYINANYISNLVTGQSNQFIATQGPIEQTSESFWRMVWLEKASAVIMLCGLEEHGRVACHVYYPELGDKTDKPAGKAFTLKLVENKALNKFYIIRKIQLTNNETGESRIIDQYHV